MKYLSISGLILYWAGCILFTAFSVTTITSIKRRVGLSYIRLLIRTNEHRAEIIGGLLIPLCCLLIFGVPISNLVLPLLKDKDKPPIISQPTDQLGAEEDKDTEKEATVPVVRTLGPIQAYAPVRIKDDQGNATDFYLYIFFQDYYCQRKIEMSPFAQHTDVTFSLLALVAGFPVAESSSTYDLPAAPAFS